MNFKLNIPTKVEVELPKVDFKPRGLAVPVPVPGHKPASVRLNTSASPQRLFGPSDQGGLSRPSAYHRVEVGAGHNLARIAADHGSTPYKIAAASGLKRFHVSPGQTLVVPGPALLVDADFKKTAAYYKEQYTVFESRVEKDTSLNPSTRPQIGAQVSTANYSMSWSKEGAVLKSTHIDIDKRKAALRTDLTAQRNEEWSQELAPPSESKVERLINVVNKVDGQGLSLAEGHIHLDPAQNKARTQAIAEHNMTTSVARRKPTEQTVKNLANQVSGQGLKPVAQQIHLDAQNAAQEQADVDVYVREVFSKGRNELSLTENRWVAAFEGHAAGLYDVLGHAAQALGAHDTAQWAQGKRVHKSHQAELALERARAQGAIEHTDQIESWSDYGNWIAGLGIQTVPYLMDMAAGAATGGVALGARFGVNAARAGGFAASYPSSVGAIYSAQRDQNGTTHSGAAFGLGALHAAANLFGFEGQIISGNFFKSTSLALNRMQGVKGGLARSAHTGVKMGPVEGGTEAFQFQMETLGQMAVDPGRNYWTEDTADGTWQSFLAGTAIGSKAGSAFGWRRGGVPERVDDIKLGEHKDVYAPIWTSASAGASRAPTGDATLDWLGHRSPGRVGPLFHPSTLEPNKTYRTMQAQSAVEQSRDIALRQWSERTDEERQARHKHVLEVLRKTETTTYHILLDRLNGMVYGQIAANKGLTKEQVKRKLNTLANQLAGNPIEGDATHNLVQLLSGVFDESQTVSGLAYVLTHHHAAFASTYYADALPIAPQNSRMTLDEAEKLLEAVRAFDPRTERYIRSFDETYSSTRRNAMQALGLRSLSDAHRLYKNGLTGLAQDLEAIIQEKQAATTHNVSQKKILNFLMTKDDKTLLTYHLRLNNTSLQEIAHQIGESVPNVRAKLYRLAALFNSKDLDPTSLDAHLTGVLRENETGRALLDRIVHQFDAFKQEAFADAPIKPVSALALSELELFVLLRTAEGAGFETIAQERGSNKEAITAIKARVIKKLNGINDADVFRRYAGGKEQLKADIQAQRLLLEQKVTGSLLASSELKREDTFESDIHGDARAYTPHQRVLNALMWARTPVLNYALDYLSSPSTQTFRDKIETIAAKHQVTQTPVISALSVLVDKMRGEKLQEGIHEKLGALEGLLEGVVDGMAPKELIRTVLTDAHGFGVTYLTHAPIKTLEQAHLSDAGLLFLKKALDDPETSWLFKNASIVYAYEAPANIAVLRRFNAFSFNDLLRRYHKDRGQLKRDVDALVAARGLGTSPYQSLADLMQNPSTQGEPVDALALTALMSGTQQQVQEVLQRSASSIEAVSELPQQISDQQRQALKLLMSERTSALEDLLKQLNGHSNLAIANQRGASRHTINNLFERLAAAISGDDTRTSSDIRAVLHEVFGQAHVAQKFIEALIAQSDQVIQKYQMGPPVQRIHQAALSIEQVGVLYQAVTTPEHLWTLQQRRIDDIGHALGAYSIHDLLRRYFGGLAQLKNDLQEKLTQHYVETAGLNELRASQQRERLASILGLGNPDALLGPKSMRWLGRPGPLFHPSESTPSTRAVPTIDANEHKAAQAAWDALTPIQRQARAAHVLDVLRNSRTLAYQVLLDTLNHMTMVDVAKKHGIKPELVNTLLSTLANKLLGQKALQNYITSPQWFAQQLQGVLTPQQTAIGLAYTLVHHYDVFAQTYYADVPVVRLAHTNLQLNHVLALENALDRFDPLTERISGLSTNPEKNGRNKAYKAMGVVSLSDAARRYPGGLEGLRTDIEAFKALHTTSADTLARRTKVLAVILKQDHAFHKAMYAFLTKSAGETTAQAMDRAGYKNGTSTFWSLASSLALSLSNKKVGAPSQLPQLLDQALKPGESAAALFDRVANRYDEFVRDELAEWQIRRINQVSLTNEHLAIIEAFIDASPTNAQVAQSLGLKTSTVDLARKTIKAKLNGATFEDALKRYPGGTDALRQDIRDLKISRQQALAIGQTPHTSVPDLVWEGIQPPTETPAQRVIATLMWARTDVLNDLLAYLKDKDSIQNSAASRGLASQNVSSALSVLVDRMRGYKTDEWVSDKIQFLEPLLTGVMSPEQTAVGLVSELIDDANAFAAKHFAFSPIKTLAQADLSPAQLIFLQNSLIDPEVSFAFTNAGQQETSHTTFKRIVAQFGAVSYSDLIRRYTNGREGLLADVRHRIHELQLDLPAYEQAAKLVSSSEIDYVAAAMDTLRKDTSNQTPLAVLLEGTYHQVAKILQPKALDSTQLTHALGETLSPEQRRIIELLFRERSRVFEQLLAYLNNQSQETIGTRAGVSRSTIEQLFKKIADDISGTDTVQVKDLRPLLYKALGSEHAAKTLLTFLIDDFDTVAKTYFAHQPIKAVRDVALPPEQWGLLEQSLRDPEKYWLIARRRLDVIAEAFNAYSIHDLFRRYPGGITQLEIDVHEANAPSVRASVQRERLALALGIGNPDELIGPNGLRFLGRRGPVFHSSETGTNSEKVAVSEHAAAQAAWDALTPEQRVSRQKHVLDVLRKSKTLAYGVLLDRLNGMQVKDIAAKRHIRPHLAQGMLNSLADQLLGGGVHNISAADWFRKELQGVFGPNQTAVGLAYTLTYHFQQFAQAYYGASPLIPLAQTNLTLSQVKALETGLNAFEPDTEIVRLTGKNNRTEQEYKSLALKAIGAASWSDIARRYPGGLEGLRADIDAFKNAHAQPLKAQVKRRDQVLALIMAEGETFHRAWHAFLTKEGGETIDQLSNRMGFSGSGLYKKLRRIARVLNNNVQVSPYQLHALLDGAVKPGESAVDLLSRVAYDFDTFVKEELPDSSVPSLKQVHLTDHLLDILEVFVATDLSLNEVAEQLGVSYSAIEGARGVLIERFNGFTFDDVLRRYPGGKGALLRDIRARKAMGAHTPGEDYRVVAASVAPLSEQEAKTLRPPTETHAQRVAAALMMSRTDVHRDLLAFLQKDKTIDQIGADRGLATVSIVKGLAVLVDRIRGYKADETVHQKIEALETLLTGVFEPNQTALELAAALDADVNAFANKYFAYFPIKTLAKANLSPAQLLFLRKAIDDNEVSFAFQNAGSSTYEHEYATFNRIIAQLGALSVSDLARRYPGGLSALSVAIDTRIKELGLDLPPYELAARLVASVDIDYAQVAMGALAAASGQKHPLQVLLEGSTDQVRRMLQPKTLDPATLERDLGATLPVERFRVVETLFEERSLVFEYLLDYMSGQSITKIAINAGVSSSVINISLKKIARKLSGNEDAQTKDLPTLLPQVLGGEQAVKTLLTFLVYDFDAVARRYFAHQPIKSIRNVPLSPSQLSLLTMALRDPEKIWSIQSRSYDQIANALGAYSIYDVLRRYPGGVAQLRLDLGLAEGV